MLLLIPRHYLECPTIEPGDLTDSLDNIFDIGLGLIEDRYLHMTKETNQPVYFITAKSFTNVPNKKYEQSFVYNEWEQVKNFNPEWSDAIKNGKMLLDNQLKDIGESGKILESKGYIKENRILKPHDFLISIRGEPIGYSLLKMDEIKSYNIVSSHYFVKLTPRYPGKFNIEYLHIILDQFTKHKLVDLFQELQENKKETGKSYASFNSFSVDELKSMKIKYHSHIEKQNEIAELFRAQFEKWHFQNMIFNQFENTIYNSLTQG
jgi:hypothetical protein